MPKETFWTRERLVKMRDVYLPQAATVQEAVDTASNDWDADFGWRQFHQLFLEQFGDTPGTYVGGKSAITGGASPDVTDLIAREALLKRQVKSLESEVRSLRETHHFERQVLDLLHEGVNRAESVPRWTAEHRHGGGMYHGIPTLFLSDLHWDETVYKAQVDGWNEYNRGIAAQRLERVFTKAVYLLEDVFTKAEYPGIVLALGGDMMSGVIHEELRETNGGPIFTAMFDLVDHLKAGIQMLHDRFGRVFIPCTPGNHGRLDRKPRHKNGPQDNVDWLLYQVLARELAGLDGVDVYAPTSFTTLYKVYGVRYLLLHGHQFRGGAGISGPILPWMLGHHRLKGQTHAVESWKPDIAAAYDCMLFGHWHKYAPLHFEGFICNGSLKGFDEFAKNMNFRYEPPIQALWMTHPEHKITFSAPVHADKHEPSDDEVSQWVTLPSHLVDRA